MEQYIMLIINFSGVIIGLFGVIVHIPEAIETLLRLKGHLNKTK